LYRKQKTLTVIGLLCVLALVVSVHQVRAEPKFAIASWSFPDPYGQGIEGFFIYENSTGSWLIVDGYSTHDDPNVFNWTVGVAIKLFCYTWFNSTLTGATSGANGKNFQRHSVIVTDLADNTVFSKQNFTYDSVDTGIEPFMWLYGYYVILNFLPAYAEYYTVTVTYEIYW
jgi:hypothetical protein